MQSNDLKKIIKKVVRESLYEVITEEFLKVSLKNHIQKIIKETISKEISGLLLETRQPTKQKSLRESVAPQETQIKQKRKSLLDYQMVNTGPKNSGVDHFADLVKDTLNSNHPLITGEDGGDGSVSTPSISEDIMADMGLFSKDYSKMLGED